MPASKKKTRIQSKNLSDSEKITGRTEKLLGDRGIVACADTSGVPAVKPNLPLNWSLEAFNPPFDLLTSCFFTKTK